MARFQKCQAPLETSLLVQSPLKVSALLFSIFLAAVDVLGQAFNPTRKPWQVYYNFLRMWGNPLGGTIFSGFSGLGSLEQALMMLGRWTCVSFEKDERMFKAQCKILAGWQKICQSKINTLGRRLDAEMKLQELIIVHQQDPNQLKEEEVLKIHFVFLGFLEEVS